MNRKLFLCLLMTACVLMGYAKRISLHVDKAGTLSTLIGTQKNQITHLTLSGLLNGDDLLLLREMAGRDSVFSTTEGHLTSLNLEKTQLVAGGSLQRTGFADLLPEKAFYRCHLTELKLPEGLLLIGAKALAGLPLKTIALPEGVELDKLALADCPQLESIQMPKQLALLNPRALYNLPALRSLEFQNVAYMAGNAIDHLESVTEIVFHGTVGHIDGSYTINDCKNLREIRFEGIVLETGGPQALTNCPKLERCIFGDVVLTTGFGTPENCPKFRGYDFCNYLLVENDNVTEEIIDRQEMCDYAIVLTDRCKEAYDEMKATIHPRHKGLNWIVQYIPANLAVSYALCRDGEKGLACLNEAADNGFRYYTQLDKIPNVEVMKALPGWQTVVQKIRENGDYLYILQQSAPYNLSAEGKAFTYEPASSANLTRVREYFNLDAVAGEGSEVEQMQRIMTWLHDTIQHNGRHFPSVKSRDAISLFDKCVEEKEGLNCRGLATILSELYMAMGWPSRFVTCESRAYDSDSDCHVICMVWSKDLNKWIWMDPSFNAWVTDENGTLLGLLEVRERLIDGRPLVLNEEANWNHKEKQTAEHYLYNYMAKNLYLMSTYLDNGFGSESREGKTYVTLVPEGFNYHHSPYATSNPSYFFQSPQ